MPSVISGLVSNMINVAILAFVHMFCICVTKLSPLWVIFSNLQVTGVVLLSLPTHLSISYIINEMFVLLCFLTCFFLSFDNYVVFVWSTPSTLALQQVSYLWTNLTYIKRPANANFCFCQVFISATRGCYYNAPSRV